MGRMFRILSGAILTFSIALIASTTSGQKPAGDSDAKKLKNPVASSPGSIAAGQKLFRVYCRLCHGTDGKGNGPQAPKDSHPSDLTDDKWDHGSSDGEIFAVIRDGAGPKFDMKGYRSKLTEEDMWNLVNYIRSIGPQGKSH
jgi:mono/diheme cytochrome c family protein